MSKKRVRHHVNPLSDQTEVRFEGFDNGRPIIVDVGADRGEFSACLLEQKKETHNFIVSEIRKPLVDRLRKKFEEEEGVYVCGGDFVRNVRTILLPCIDQGAPIEEVYFNFPDPWFKERHHKRRVVCTRLLDEMSQWITGETRFIYQTDQGELFEDTITLLQEHGLWDITYFDASPHNCQTKWEAAKASQGERIYRMNFVRKNTK